ncbi:hypothetical protein GCM10008018_36390 [Paenibacillus marchantiophytorum]|uniref:Uncharacterized protein n=1 Tax=Paenibacillus marchantiophytorum TaxID=1619310 RepID=A0ABQ1ETT6_9BACL|nr:hypothetical protein GCM10008018_36390 [Paenibacillus marchantiophytorum]
MGHQIRWPILLIYVLLILFLLLQDAVIELVKTVPREYYESIGLGEAYTQQVARETMEDHS